MVKEHNLVIMEKRFIKGNFTKEQEMDMENNGLVKILMKVNGRMGLKMDNFNKNETICL